jgi:hypothetical protein
MGATLRYAKVIDQQEYQRRGAEVKPGLESVIYLSDDPPAAAAPFYVLRSYSSEFDAFTETLRIVDPHGRSVGEPMTREVLSGQGEIADQLHGRVFEYADDGYQLVLEIDGREVARAGFPVRAPQPEQPAQV